MDFPDSVKQNHPSRHVLVRSLNPKIKKTERLLPALKAGGHHLNGKKENTANAEVLESITGALLAAETTLNTLAKASPSGPPVAPAPDEACDVLIINMFR